MKPPANSPLRNSATCLDSALHVRLDGQIQGRAARASQRIVAKPDGAGNPPTDSEESIGARRTRVGDGTSYGSSGRGAWRDPGHYGGNYDSQAWFSLLEQEGVTFGTSQLHRVANVNAGRCFHLPEIRFGRLKYIFSVGEPLNPEVIHWSRKVLHHDIYDTWWQTETGAIMIANRPAWRSGRARWACRSPAWNRPSWPTVREPAGERTRQPVLEPGWLPCLSLT